jgi:hypothetical protein
MATVGTVVLGEDRLVGCFQWPPTTFPGGDFADFFEFLSRERQTALRLSGNVKLSKAPWPESAVEHSVIRTEYLPVYRLQSKTRFESGVRYPLNWASSEWNLSHAYRYSPIGTEGFYLGLTLPAAEGEARFWGKGTIDPEKFMILVLYCCFDNVLYVTPRCLNAIWTILGFDRRTSVMDMLLNVMNTKTGNEITDAIGLWARERGLDGIVYPSARYGQEKWIERALEKDPGLSVIPAINIVDMGSHLCRGGIREEAMGALTGWIEQSGGLDRCIPAWAELNLVMFSGSQVSGDRWGVIYRSFPLSAREEVLSLDDPARRFSSYMVWGTQEKPGWLN